MSVLIFRLNGVSEEEAREVRDLLLDSEFDFYETSAGRWGFAVAGLWLKDKNQQEQAKKVIAVYQRERELYFESLRNEVPAETLLDRFKKSPIQFVSYSLLAVFIVFLSLSPFVNLFVA
ncbi:MAG: hypothetical protein ACI92E_003069 [Oceanicoccus sp.]|jgi:hypothetical protein